MSSLVDRWVIIVCWCVFKKYFYSFKACSPIQLCITFLLHYQSVILYWCILEDSRFDAFLTLIFSPLPCLSSSHLDSENPPPTFFSILIISHTGLQMSSGSCSCTRRDERIFFNWYPAAIRLLTRVGGCASFLVFITTASSSPEHTKPSCLLTQHKKKSFPIQQN